MARCTCTGCGRVKDVRAAHGVTNKRIMVSGLTSMKLGKPGQAIKKIEAQGWHSISKKIYCPNCVEARRSKEILHMDTAPASTNVAQIAPRQPTPKQKREIIGILEVCYDDEAKRYKGGDTDKSVADILGEGVMLGWVSSIREEMFGPDGGNAEMDEVATQVRDLVASVRVHEQKVLDHAEKAREHADAVVKFGDHARVLLKRVETIKKSVGPKAAGA